MNPFSFDGVWVKGNLHSHTNNSDGVLSPSEVVKYYCRNGFDFLALTDHDKITRIDSNCLILFSGIEVTVKNGVSYHVVGIDVDDENYILKLKDDSIQSLLNYISERGLAIIAHPYWSNLTINDLLILRNYVGIEIYNAGCDVEVAKGYSIAHWDCIISKDTGVYGFAVDDAHWYNGFDAPGGWILVKVRDKSRDEIITSIKEGRFYSTMGPLISEFKSVGNIVNASFTPVNRVDIVSENGSGFSFSMNTYHLIKSGIVGIRNFKKVKLSSNGDIEKLTIEIDNGVIEVYLSSKGIIGILIEGFKFKNYLRLEITDFNGRKAWSNPVKI
ncbi:MAG: hypothetical protein QW743_08160 [Candidatus Methanomethylicia archaeon]